MAGSGRSWERRSAGRRIYGPRRHLRNRFCRRRERRVGEGPGHPRALRHPKRWWGLVTSNRPAVHWSGAGGRRGRKRNERKPTWTKKGERGKGRREIKGRTGPDGYWGDTQLGPGPPRRTRSSRYPGPDTLRARSSAAKRARRVARAWSGSVPSSSRGFRTLAQSSSSASARARRRPVTSW